MKNLLYIYLLFIVIISCDFLNKKTQRKDADTRIVREFYENRKLKSVISVKGNMRHGTTKNYDLQGNLSSEINYSNNKKDGLSKDYYPTGKIHASINYTNGIKNGEETWFYENGKPYRINIYSNGKINGIQKWYYKNGKLMGEVPYKNGLPGIGLKEFSEKGEPISNYPEIVIQEINQVMMTDKFILNFTLSNHSKNVKFYLDSLSEGKYMRKYMYDIPLKKGIATQVYNVPPGFLKMQKINIVAEYTTPRRLPYILQKSYNLALQH